MEDLAARIASLEAERRRPEVPEHIAGALPPAAINEAMEKLIGLLAQLFRKERT